MLSRSTTESSAPAVVHARFGAAGVIVEPGLVSEQSQEEWQKLCGTPREDSFGGLYAAFTERGLAYGPSFQVLRA